MLYRSFATLREHVSAVEQGLLRSDRGVVRFAAFQPGADRYRYASTDAAGSLPGLDRYCRGCRRPPGPFGTCLLPFCIVQLSWPSPCVLVTTANLQRFSLYTRLVTFRSARAGQLKDFTDRHAQSTPCAAREKNRVLLSHAAQGVYQTYI